MSNEPRPLDPQKLLDVLRSIDSSLSQLAAAARLPYVYPDGTVESLREQYGKLKYADTYASDKLQLATNEVGKDGLSYEERVKKFGELDAKRHSESIIEAMQARRKTAAELGEFREEHPLIATIVDGTRF